MAGAGAARERLVEITIPVYNEEKVLAGSIERLHAYLTEHLHFPFIITIADNASSDGTLAVAQQLREELPQVRVVHLDMKGRGRALRHVWGNSEADIVAYMDADLSTGLDAFLPLIAPLVAAPDSKHSSDLAVGTRLAPGANVVRGPKREIISRAYNVLLHAVLNARFSDAQCGFKAVRADVAQRLLPWVADTGWFFDTELLVLALRGGFRIHEVPVDWVEDPDSRVDIVATAIEDLKGIRRLRAAASAADHRTVASSLTR
jgi:glycosyltransferase involved in cell wall biosynthesis